MKKIWNFIFLSMLFIIPGEVLATNVKGYATASDLLIASAANLEKPNNSCIYRQANGSYSSVYAAPGVLHCLDVGDEVVVLDYDNKIASNISSCTQGFYQVMYTKTNGNAYKGYVCADYIRTNIDTSKYANEFKAAGLPEIYYEKLTLLKDLYPKWKFTAYNTNLEWKEVIANESIVGLSYIQSSNPLYLSLDEGSYDASTNTYKMQEVGGWYAANKATVAYYMDPRNFLDEKQIFMFENLGYNPTYQTEETVKGILTGTNLLQYSTYFIESATYNGNNVSPTMLAARSLQEVVKGDGTLSNSANGESGYYNFYNLGAFSSCANPIDCAIEFASGYGGSYTSFNRPWTSAEAAIKNGASYIASGYINVGQNTLYFQKWNVTNNSYGNYSHQYMTNIAAPISEAKSTYSAYSNIDGLLNSEIEFIIPVYENMPTEISALPNKVDEEEIENKKEEQNIINISDILGKSGYSISGDFLVNINIGETAVNVISKLKATSSSVDVEIVRGDKSIYANEVLATNDIVKIKNDGNEYTFRTIIYGDVNGDGVADAIDYVKLYKYIMGSSGLNGSYKEAADLNKDGSVDAIDFVKLYKQL